MPGPGPDALRRAWWVLLAAVPAALLIGVTTDLSTDVAAVPFLWIVPLIVYLATLILAFARAVPIGARSGPSLAAPRLGACDPRVRCIVLPIGPSIALHLGMLASAGLALADDSRAIARPRAT